MYSDHIQDSDINVCRTIGDYDLGRPLKYRDAEGNPAGPLTSGALGGMRYVLRWATLCAAAWAACSAGRALSRTL